MTTVADRHLIEGDAVPAFGFDWGLTRFTVPPEVSRRDFQAGEGGVGRAGDEIMRIEQGVAGFF